MIMNPMPTQNKVDDLRRNYGLEGKPDIDVAFYFDTTMMGMKAVSSMKEAGTWPSISYTRCNDYIETDPILRTVDLKTAIKSV
jgi:hypothetical protein